MLQYNIMDVQNEMEHETPHVNGRCQDADMNSDLRNKKRQC
jgi:hypothetical protein